MANFGIYIHWPYCLSKCPYCDFFSKVKPGIDQAAIVEGYLDDLDYYAALTSERTVTSVFFGGGTPSLLRPELIAKILDRIFARWHMAPEAEISLEANPGSNTPSLFSDLKNAGINRLSLGVQALNTAGLKFLGRRHSLQQALKALEQITCLFDNHSADLIYARPGQQLSDWERELRQITSFGLRHLSLYQLTIEPGTVFYKQGIRPLEENAAATMYEATNTILEQAGYPRYEISNYSHPGWNCRHNLLYWQGGDYLGIGPAAHGRLELGGKYYALSYPRKMELLTPFERAEELLLMGLRLKSGIDKQNFHSACGLEFDYFINTLSRDQLVAEGYLTDSPHSLCATPAGFNILNYLIEQLCP